tara:strand:- start:24 stop:191 length:168 start_codon:yes stop_codon:yes gene_type:complete
MGSVEPPKLQEPVAGEEPREVEVAVEEAAAGASLELLDFLNTYHFPPKRLSCCSS